ncbi:hypothetical protein E7T06_09415 [Deinococcus sp. Arct2-2]|uniref:hypothetical protein n=1 Tax=Deinococcus sp. Arct2-2 TaxID=2568653 RepID=UPI0010A3AC25|nr:hypothetical protein [Deinococcus sp. Arct2-2]THF69966.1 hypothetical protein E7T06_09415 [Deinococcus sp. Arct2-2]
MSKFTVYTVSLNHFATGEGVLMQVLVACAQSEDEALELFWHAFYRGEPQPRTFWPTVRPGVDRELLRDWCTAGALDQLEALARASDNLSFSLSCSYSLE